MVNYCHGELHFICYKGTTSIAGFFNCGSEVQRKHSLILTRNIETEGYLHFFDHRKWEKMGHFSRVGKIARLAKSG